MIRRMARDFVEKVLEAALLKEHAYGVPKGQLEIRDHLNDRRGSFGTLCVYAWRGVGPPAAGLLAWRSFGRGVAQ